MWRARRAQTFAMAMLLLVVGGVAAWLTDAVREPPADRPAEIFLYGDNPLDVSRGGWAALVTVSEHACQNPVHVSITLAGTLELWKSIRQHGDHVHQLAVSAIPHPIRRLSIDVDRVGAETLGSQSPPEPLRGRVHFVDGIRATVPHWWQTWEPISVAFDANWIAARSLGSCFLRLPSLTSFRQDAQSEGAVPAPYFQSISYGQVALVTADRLDVADSTRPLSDPHDRIWTCALDSNSPLGHYRNTGQYQGALTLAQFRALPSAASDCGGVAVLERPWAAGVHDLLLLIVGGAIGLSMALLVETARGRA
jgi:hypothetical protein